MSVYVRERMITIKKFQKLRVVRQNNVVRRQNNVVQKICGASSRCDIFLFALKRQCIRSRTLIPFFVIFSPLFSSLHFLSLSSSRLCCLPFYTHLINFALQLPSLLSSPLPFFPLLSPYFLSSPLLCAPLIV